MTESETSSETFLAQTVDAAGHKERLDKFLSHHCPHLSRSRLKSLILQGQVMVDQEVVTNPALKLKEEQVIELEVPPAEEYLVTPENIPLDVLYEDEDLLVINKSADMVVHPAAGNWSGTLVHALLYHCGDSLSGIGGVLRPGIVHRLDKGTSGVMIAAKNDYAHAHLSAQLADRSLSRTYQALVIGRPHPRIGTIDAALGRHPRDRQKIVVRQQGGKEARTHYKILETFGEALSLMECKLETGRTHQIRVHMESIKHPLIGDPLYGEQPTKTRSLLKKDLFSAEVQEACLSFPRQALHAHEIRFLHPRTEDEMSLSAPLPEDLQKLINLLKNNGN
ncbi:MAG: RluA family pseudouridine synthase [Rhodospirillales bacterium]|nr:RluA family pseudouridine synthase [Rhodospirillales bacterium]MCB9965732.1 RluA family pseudouridine synthase [Rhodospirillales bacterium]MCB9979660.1 RluA family pseudouridine synthase [Rhodospirillales bacterium]